MGPEYRDISLNAPSIQDIHLQPSQHYLQTTLLQTYCLMTQSRCHLKLASSHQLFHAFYHSHSLQSETAHTLRHARDLFKSTPVPLRYTATVLSRLTDSSHWPSGENCSCVTVRLCAVRDPRAVQVEVSHSHTAAVLLVWALQADASKSPEGEAATQNSSAPCPYSLATSGHRLLCARCSSRGGPAEATFCCARICTHIQHTALSSHSPVMQNMPVPTSNSHPKFGISYTVTTG